jgi:hypothetical protein
MIFFGFLKMAKPNAIHPDSRGINFFQPPAGGEVVADWGGRFTAIVCRCGTIHT